MIGQQGQLARGAYASQGASALGLRQPAAMRAATRLASGAPVEINASMQGAREEISHWPEYDYVLINDDLDRTVAEMSAIIERCRERA